MNDFYIDPSAIVDENVTIGKDTKVWHFSHVQSNTTLGDGCTLGQNVNIGSNVLIGNFVKIQNNVSVWNDKQAEPHTPERTVPST